jgi:hypothetical protein
VALIALLIAFTNGRIFLRFLARCQASRPVAPGAHVRRRIQASGALNHLGSAVFR